MRPLLCAAAAFPGFRTSVDLVRRPHVARCPELRATSGPYDHDVCAGHDTNEVVLTTFVNRPGSNNAAEVFRTHCGRTTGSLAGNNDRVNYANSRSLNQFAFKIYVACSIHAPAKASCLSASSGSTYRGPGRGGAARGIARNDQSDHWCGPRRGLYRTLSRRAFASTGSIHACCTCRHVWEHGHR